MYKQTCTSLTDLTRGQVLDWFDSFDTILVDCDGVLWNIETPIEGSVEAINNLRNLKKKKVFFITNNSTKTRQELLEKTNSMGANLNLDEIICTAHAVALYLQKRNFNKKVYVIGNEGISRELDLVGIKYCLIGPDPLTSSFTEFVVDELELEPNVGAVIVGFDEHISYPKLAKAASYLGDPDCLFLATNMDERFTMPGYVVPGTGCIVRAIETCCERYPILIGKPNPNICEHLINEGTIVPEKTLIIGDRCQTDVLLGANCGFQTMLVGSGLHKPSFVHEYMKKGTERSRRLIPDFYLPTLGELLRFL